MRDPYTYWPRSWMRFSHVFRVTLLWCRNDIVMTDGRRGLEKWPLMQCKIIQWSIRSNFVEQKLLSSNWPQKLPFSGAGILVSFDNVNHHPLMLTFLDWIFMLRTSGQRAYYILPWCSYPSQISGTGFLPALDNEVYRADAKKVPGHYSRTEVYRPNPCWENGSEGQPNRH